MLQLNQPSTRSGLKRQDSQPDLPPGFDPGLARQALQSGISHGVGEFAKIVRGGKHEEQEEEEGRGGRPGEDAVEGDAGSANPIEKEALPLSKIVGPSSKKKKKKLKLKGTRASKPYWTAPSLVHMGDGLPRRRIRRGAQWQQVGCTSFVAEDVGAADGGRLGSGRWPLALRLSP